MGITSVKLKAFEKQIEYLHNHDFRTISINDYLTTNHIPSKAVIITFDDAFASVYENAFPILTRYNFTATIFVITKFIGDSSHWDYSVPKSPHCNWKHLKELSDAGWEVGSHTMTHPNLKSLSERELWVELKSSKEYLENYLDKTINVISYPFGKFNERVIELTQKADYLGGCTLGYNFPHTQSFPYELFRRGVYFLEPFFLFKAKLRNGKLSHMDDLKQRFITSCSQGTLLYNYFKSILKTT